MSVQIVTTEEGPSAVLEWVSQDGLIYSISCATNLSESFELLPNAINMPYPINSYTDILDTAESTKFYRISEE